ncbi:hypothetical protein D3C83_37190 [compost metagenome]
MPEMGHQHLVARGQRVADGRFPAAGAGGWEYEHPPGFRFEDLLQILEQRERELGEVHCAHVLLFDGHGIAHPLRHVGGTGNEKKVATWHGWPPEGSK